MINYTHGTVLLLTGRGIENRERMIIRKSNKYYPLDLFTGNVVDIHTLNESFNTAEEIATAYRLQGYVVVVKEKRENIGMALYELNLLHKKIDPSENSNIDRHFKNIIEILND